MEMAELSLNRVVSDLRSRQRTRCAGTAQDMVR